MMSYVTALGNSTIFTVRVVREDLYIYVYTHARPSRHYVTCGIKMQLDMGVIII